MVYLFILLVNILFIGSSFGQNPGCSIKINNALDAPLLISDVADAFLLPELGRKHITIPEGSALRLACPGTTISNVDNNSKSIITATCLKQKLIYNKKTIDPAVLKCAREPVHTARFTKNACESGGKEAEIGYVLENNKFLRVILICFDSVNQIALYSHYNLPKSIASRSRDIGRPEFIEDAAFYRLKTKVNNLYTRFTQRRIINTLLGLTANSKQYIQDGEFYFISRGHLASKTDFIYAAQQQATFHYINAAPQWQTFNDGNWLAVENDARYIASKKKVDLRVYTGTYGVASLPHVKRKTAVKLYLYVDGYEKRLPVPAVFWKVLYDPVNKEGIALVGLNNPYLTNLNGYILCNDVSPNIAWLQWQKKNVTAGVSYACSVDELRKQIPHIPLLDIQKLLV